MYRRLGAIALLAAMILLSQQDLYGQSHRRSSGYSSRRSYSTYRHFSSRSHSRHSYSYRSTSPRTSYRASQGFRRNSSHLRPHTYRAPHLHSARPARSYRAHSYAVGGRDRRGRLRRSGVAKDAFMRSTGHARGWPGHVVDHRIPLACGGSDTPSNMQWQTREAAREKDRVERRGCRGSR
jgi:hypothetical protein